MSATVMMSGMVGSDGFRGFAVMSDSHYQKSEEGPNPVSGVPDVGPVKPEGKKGGMGNLLRWLFFLFVIIYVLISYYHAPILRHLGGYLIVKHPPQKSDLIVCLAGKNIERGLASVDAYRRGLAPHIFMAREDLPDGLEILRGRGVSYPDGVDLLMMMMKKMGVPDSALFVSDRPVNSTLDEAKVVREFAGEKGCHSLILITSPTHSRRAWLTFRKAFEKEDVRILVHPSPYSGFNPDDWWKRRRYLREVIIEYEKLIYYALKYLW